MNNKHTYTTLANAKIVDHSFRARIIYEYLNAKRSVKACYDQTLKLSRDWLRTFSENIFLFIYLIAFYIPL